MTAQRICGIKALSNIKQNGEQQSEEESGKKTAAAYDFTLLFAALSLSPSSIGSLLLKDGITAVREGFRIKEQFWPGS